VAAHEFDETFGDGETEAGAGFGRATVGGLVERLEEVGLIFFGDADAGVFDGEGER